MKKTYINPNITVVKMHMHQYLLNASNGALSTSEDDRITSSDGFGAREFDFEDEE